MRALIGAAIGGTRVLSLDFGSLDETVSQTWALPD